MPGSLLPHFSVSYLHSCTSRSLAFCRFPPVQAWLHSIRSPPPALSLLPRDLKMRRPPQLSEGRSNRMSARECSRDQRPPGGRGGGRTGQSRSTGADPQGPHRDMCSWGDNQSCPEVGSGVLSFKSVYRPGAWVQAGPRRGSTCKGGSLQLRAAWGGTAWAWRQDTVNISENRKPRRTGHGQEEAGPAGGQAQQPHGPGSSQF